MGGTWDHDDYCCYSVWGLDGFQIKACGIQVFLGTHHGLENCGPGNVLNP